MRGYKAYRALVLLALAAAALTASGSAPGSPENPWVVTAPGPRILPKPSLHAGASAAAALVRREGDASPLRAAAELRDADSTGPSWRGVDSGLAMPGSAGAIGPSSYLQLVNGKFGLYDRSGAELSTGALADLAPPDAPAGGHGAVLAEPQALWDPATSRFYYAFLDLDPHFASATGRSYVVFGFSRDDAPTGPSSFCNYYLDYHYEHLDGLPDGDAVYPDSPRLGDTRSFILLGVNVVAWHLGSGFGSDVDWIEKPAP